MDERAEPPAGPTARAWRGLGVGGGVRLESARLLQVDLPFRRPVATAVGVHRQPATRAGAARVPHRPGLARRRVGRVRGVGRHHLRRRGRGRGVRMRSTTPCSRHWWRPPAAPDACPRWARCPPTCHGATGRWPGPPWRWPWATRTSAPQIVRSPTCSVSRRPMSLRVPSSVSPASTASLDGRAREARGRGLRTRQGEACTRDRAAVRGRAGRSVRYGHPGAGRRQRRLRPVDARRSVRTRPAGPALHRTAPWSRRPRRATGSSPPGSPPRSASTSRLGSPGQVVSAVSAPAPVRWSASNRRASGGSPPASTWWTGAVPPASPGGSAGCSSPATPGTS